jgi:glycosyltransferase 2 family protein
MPHRRPLPLWRRHAPLLVAATCLVLGFGWILKRGALPLWPPAGTLARVDWVKASVAVAALVASTQLRFARYTFLISSIVRLPMRRLMAISNIAGALVSFLPFRLGEFARPAMLREKGRISGLAVAGTVGAERMIDALLFGLMLLLGLSLAVPREPVADHVGTLRIPAVVPWVAWLMTGVSLAAFAAAAAFYWLREAARAATEAIIGIFSKRLGVLVASAVERASHGFAFLTNVPRTAQFLAVSVFALFLHVLGLRILASAVGLSEVTLTQAAVLTGVLGLAFALPNAPGFFGSVQMALYAGLALYVHPDRVITEGAAFVFLFYLSYLGMTVIGSLIGLLLQSRDAVLSTAGAPHD